MPPRVLLDQPLIRIRPLRVLVQRLHVGVSRRGIEIEIRLLHVLAMVSLVPCEPKQALLENRILPVPDPQSKAHPPLPVADAQQAVLAPPVSPAARVVMREVFPALACRRIVLTDRAPLTLGQV